MPLTVPGLSAAIDAAIAQAEASSPDAPITRAELANAIARAIVTQLKATTVLVTGVQPGGGVATGVIQ